MISLADKSILFFLQDLLSSTLGRPRLERLSYLILFCTVRLCRFFSILALLQCLLPPLPAHAWGTEGHRIIAALAQRQLTPAARKEIDRLLALEPGETLESISTWADEHRSPATAPWHYVNFPRSSCTYDAERDCPNGRCVVAAIEKQIDILRFEVSDQRRLNALKYLVHFVADVHQPLHAGYLDDKGGNTYQLQVFMRGTNLHALWDKGLISNLNEDLETTVNRLWKRSSQFNQSDLSMIHAAQESCRIVGTPGYYPDRKVDMDYIKRFTPVMEERLFWAGNRLARVLNSALSSEGLK